MNDLTLSKDNSYTGVGSIVVGCMERLESVLKDKLSIQDVYKMSVLMGLLIREVVINNKQFDLDMLTHKATSIQLELYHRYGQQFFQILDAMLKL